MFSATFPKEIQKLARDFLGDYIWVAVGVVGGAVDSIKQDFVFCEKNEKQDKLFEQLEHNFANATRALIFVNSKTICATLNDVFTERGVQAETINGDMQQHQRESALYNFRQGTTRVLLGTDVASRGLDIPSVDVVINYDLPTNRENYIHRIGRSGRFGRKGVAVNFVTAGDVRYMKDIEQFYNTQIEEMPMNVADLI